MVGGGEGGGSIGTFRRLWVKGIATYGVYCSRKVSSPLPPPHLSPTPCSVENANNIAADGAGKASHAGKRARVVVEENSTSLCEPAKLRSHPVLQPSPDSVQGSAQGLRCRCRG